MGRSLLIVLAIWAVIYLPALGSVELRGEEGRRVLPAVSMLETGDYLVPHLGGKPYFAKPPLVNWLVAGSFKLFGMRNDWSARIPSTVFVLAVAVAFVTIARRSLGATGSTVAAVAWLTSIGIIEKGRLIEIDGVYASSFALAFICWITWWLQNRSRWLTWTVPWIFLGVALLAKGPAHLIFFYAIVIALLWKRRELKLLFATPHVTGLLLMLAIFCAWAIPFLQVDSRSPIESWWRQLLLPIEGREHLEQALWLMNLPRGFSYFLPWALLLPFLRFVKIADERQRDSVKTITWVCSALFFVFLISPGAYARYVLPLVAPICWIVGLAAANRAFEWRLQLRRFSLGIPRPVIALLMAGTLVVGLVAHPVRAARYPQDRQKMKLNAAQINAAIPAGEMLFALNSQFQPYLFYVRPRIRYIGSLPELPADARYILVQAKRSEDLATRERWKALQPREVARMSPYFGHTAVLYALQPTDD